ncbi:MAG TPA: DoxX family protein [Chthonomonas sp.]|jgi:putative oxidoreductase|uniref:DoxX family protein n=1 Tax=Chthonomonas sp. TaxID=2282153 RepID=UPI002B4B0381|nr:DoxX family protein [Chthonomonas sp.]HLH80453.1 DoxX family protein [Chthonomonas sp.]
MQWNTLARTDKQEAFALLSIRLASAAAFLYHGTHILGIIGGPGIQKFAEFTHLPVPIAFLVGCGQLGSGLAMLTGVLARLGGAVTSIIMLGAIVLVHWHNGFDISKNGYEYALTLLLIGVAILIRGAGPISLVEWFRAKQASQSH